MTAKKPGQGIDEPEFLRPQRAVLQSGVYPPANATLTEISRPGLGIGI